MLGSPDSKLRLRCCEIPSSTRLFLWFSLSLSPPSSHNNSSSSCSAATNCLLASSKGVYWGFGRVFNPYLAAQDPSSSADTGANSDSKPPRASSGDLNLRSTFAPPMTSAHRYPPPQTTSQNDFRLPSLKDLNFPYRRPASGPQSTLSSSSSQQVELGEHPQAAARNPAAWARAPPNGSTSVPSSVAAVHSQHVSTSHDTSSKSDYSSKHETNGGYAHPGIPLSAQATPIPGSVNTRNENTSHSPNQPKRQRTSSANMSVSRDARATHVCPKYFRKR